jgi:hypothetical protein
METRDGARGGSRTELLTLGHYTIILMWKMRLPTVLPSQIVASAGPHSGAICATKDTSPEIDNMRKLMSIYKVKRDYEGGMWVKDHPNPVVEVRAANADEAAKLVLGKELHRKGTQDQYCAQAWPLGGVRRADEIAHFYSV